MSAQARTVELGLGEVGLDHGCRGCGGGCGGGGGGCGGGCGGCGGKGGCSTCGPGSERPRWFAGQLVGPSDLESLQQWVIGRARRHNRMLHGWGVACGLSVQAAISPVTGEVEPWTLIVVSGYALSACGDEVCVPETVRIDIRQPRPEADDACAPPVDPWCAPVRVRRDPQRTYYLAIRYAEEQRRPVRSSSCGCGCDDDPCEYSRVGETYALAVLDELPDCYQSTLQPERRASRVDAGASAAQHPSSEEARREAVGCSPRIGRLGTRPCPDCCSPWVVLADLRVDARGMVTVDMLSHRRFLASFGNYGFSCSPQRDDAPSVTILQPDGGATLPSAFREAVTFEATAQDREDGTLTGGSLQWFDSHNSVLRAPLGQGNSISATLSWDQEDRPLARTAHTVLVEATDSSGQVASDSVTVTVGEPAPLPPPARITAHLPTNGATLELDWNAHREIELDFDRDMNAAQLDQPDPWLRAWAIFPEYLDHNYTIIAKLKLVPLDGGPRRVARYGIHPVDWWQSFTYLVQVRPGRSIMDDATPPQILDGDFAGTNIPEKVLDEIWNLPEGEHKRPKGWVDPARTWTTTQKKLPSGDGKEGGLFHLLFGVKVPIN